MWTSRNSPDFQDWTMQQPSGGSKSDPWMEEYLGQTNYRLGTITERFNRGETIDSDSRDWMLNQVDFVVEALGTDPVELDDSLLSNLLQLILAIANLDQQMRNEIHFAVEES
jgi:hypothetical protein